MTPSSFRHDALLTDLGMQRGDADNFSLKLISATLQGGSVIEFEAKGVTAIAGANNCGKSTLLSQLGQKLLSSSNFPQPPLVASVMEEQTGNETDFLDWLCRNAAFSYSEENPAGSTFQRLEQSISLDNFRTWGQYETTGHLGAHPMTKPFLVRQMSAGERNVQGAGRKATVLEPASHPFHHLSESLELMDELNRLTQKILGKTLSLDDLNYQIELRVGVPEVNYPQRFEDPTEYQTAINRLPTLSSQGDGMRSLLSILIPLVTATYPVFIIDEPEAFLHPPQSFALGQELGRIAADKDVQIVLATHDRNLLAGLLNSSAPLSVVRLVRTDDSTLAHQLRSQELKEIWDDPVLKYSSVLDGLFHELVVMAENERDCRFYEAALDARDTTAERDDSTTLPATDVLFVPTSGTSGMSKVARALKALQVPVIACPDIDVLDNEIIIRGIVESLGHEWTAQMHDDWTTVTRRFGGSDEPELVSVVYLRVAKEFEKIVEAEPLARYDAANRRRVKEALGVAQRPWDEAKNYGVRVLERVSGDPAAVQRLISGLAERQVVIVHEGELESFGHSLGVPKGKGWLPAALVKGLQSSPEVQAQIAFLLDAAKPILRR
ncbi:ATP-dependent endonuclease [Arthrobacter sp. 08Y14]|uniref:ATP-dependent nuclease n=1 Tax=Arthrobacter sp. 08Y14 TaxID=2058885 RepID=UPI000CE478F6|nr:AAA family ATPase [Arthrobacter sp. 08Y14]